MKKVLIVDNKIDQELAELENILRLEDFEIQSYSNPSDINLLQESIEYQTLDYDIALVDLSLGENCKYEGSEIIEKLKQAYPRKPVLCCSGYADKPKNADGILPKKRYDPKQALDIINGFIEKFSR